MNPPCSLDLFFIFFWIQSDFICCNNAIMHHLTRQDILLLKNESDPKCFSRTREDFTCFFETADNTTYEFIYSTDERPQKKRCEMSIQRTEDGKFLHVCSFPQVFIFVQTHVEVVEKATNRSIHKRTVCVEDQILLDPPFNVSLNLNDQAGQVQVSWSKSTSDEVRAKIRYSSKSLMEKTKEVKSSTVPLLDSLVVGEELEVQVSVKSESSEPGHWSGWSDPVRTLVPQTADDILLKCHTSDLHNVTCYWDGRRYLENEFKLFYKMDVSENLSWTQWIECVADKNITDQCWFNGDQTRKVKVMLNSTSALNTRTFYTEVFSLNNTIKTFPPDHLRLLTNEELCLGWESPLPSLSADLQYEVDHKIKRGEEWMHFPTQMIRGPKTNACLEVPAGRQYSIKVRARPQGDSIYSGSWSDWSDEFIGTTTTNTDLWLLSCVPAVLLIITIIIIVSVFFSQLKQYFWPPVPNLDKVLQGFLTDMSNKKWDPPVATKQCCDETTSSLVEILSVEEVSGFLKPSEDSTEGSFSSDVQVDGSPVADVFPDYVTLNEGNGFVYTQGNSYVQVREKKDSGVGDELLHICQCSCPDGSLCVSPHYSSSDFINRSYLPLAESTEKCNDTVTATRGPGNLYTNMPHS